jgi:hypothetical protein
MKILESPIGNSDCLLRVVTLINAIEHPLSISIVCTKHYTHRA